MLSHFIHGLTIGESSKTLIAALLGVITGALLEPIKHSISNRMTARNVRKSIYYDYGRIMFFVTRKGYWEKETLLIALQTDAFDFYYDVKREMLYLLPEFQAIINLAKYIKRMRKELTADELTSADVMRELSESFEQYCRTAEIRWKEILKAKDVYETHFEEMSAAITATKSKAATQ